MLHCMKRLQEGQVSAEVTEKTEREFMYQGISTRRFKRQYNLADYVQVKSAAFDNGLLKIELGAGNPGSHETTPHRHRRRGKRQRTPDRIQGGLTSPFRFGRAPAIRGAGLPPRLEMEETMRPTTAIDDNVIDFNALLHPTPYSITPGRGKLSDAHRGREAHHPSILGFRCFGDRLLPYPNASKVAENTAGLGRGVSGLLGE